MSIINQSQSLAISYLRVTALISIFSCHILQALDNRWAWVLNIGVQVFFFLSGYLYGHKEIKDWHKWYKKRALKIYSPYIFIVVVWVTVYILFSNTNVSIINIVAHAANIQWFIGGIRGLEHLWFITAIMLCYLITPILQTFKYTPSCACIVLLFYSILEFYFAQYSLDLFIALFIYASGYLFANLSAKMQRFTIIFLILFSLHILYRLDWAYILQYDSLPNRVFHTYVGITLSILIILLLWKVVKIKCHLQLINVLDKYSYEIYLVHHPFILGSLSLMGLTDYTVLNIFIIMLCTIVLSFGLKKISNGIQTISCFAK